MFMRSAQLRETISDEAACYDTEPDDFRSEVGAAFRR
jgi:hypothetical protein